MKKKVYSPVIIKTFSILIVCWLIIIGVLIVWVINNEKGLVYEYAANEARAGFEKDLLYRHWSTIHGGTYVPVTEHTPPNPYLNHITERDILTPSGRKLTLVNPAYMTRQVHELGEKLYGMKGHITSLNPIRLENKPDDWEVESLKSFETGIIESLAIKSLEGAEYLRLMRPLIVKKNCMKCHAKQGYTEGEIRGGISISVPLKPYKAVSIKNIKNLILIFGMIALLGMMGLFWIGLLMNRKDLDKDLAIKGLMEKEHFLNSLLHAIPIPVFYKDRAGIYKGFNDAYETFLGKNRDQLIGKSVFDINPKELAEIFHAKDTELFDSPGIQRYEAKVKNANDAIRDVIFDKSVYKDPEGNVIGLIGTMLDITERIEAENKIKENYVELSELNKSLKKAMFAANQATADAEIKNYQLEIEIDQRIHSENINKALVEISTAINITPDLNALYKTIHNVLIFRLNVTNFFIAIYDKKEDLFFFPYVADEKPSKYIALKDTSQQRESLIRKVISSGKPVSETRDKPLKNKGIQDLDQKNGYLSQWLGAPLKNNDNVIGVMATQSLTEQNGYYRKDRDVFISVAKQVALAIEVKHSSDALSESEKKYKKLAYHDSLTGLANRKAFSEQIEKYCNRAKRNDEKIALFFLDIDKFKQVNDTLGHEIGDTLLIQISNRLEKSLRKVDFIARIGGDEFTIIIDNNKKFQPEKVAKKIIKILSETYHLKNKTVDYVSVSLGISIYPDDSSQPQQLIAMADKAMYKAKIQGNKYHFHSD